MTKRLSLLSLLAIGTSSIPLAQTINLTNNITRTSDTHKVKSNYTYHSAWITVHFSDTVLITTIYKQVDKLLLEQEKTGIKKNITIEKILWKITPNDYVTFSNYETILDDVEQYIKAGKVDSSYYSQLGLQGTETYSWDWAHACPGYTWQWFYDKLDGSHENLYSYYNYGYGNADQSIYFSFDVSYDN